MHLMADSLLKMGGKVDTTSNLTICYGWQFILELP